MRLSCGQTIRVNARLGPLLGWRGQKPIVCFFPRARACLGIKLQSSSLRPLKMAKPQAGFLFLSVLLPDPALGSCPRLPPLPREAFPLHDLIRNSPSLWPGPLTTHSFSSEAPKPTVSSPSPSVHRPFLSLSHSAESELGTPSHPRSLWLLKAQLA